MLEFSLLGSGSGGNAILVVSNNTKILIDNGLSFKKLNQYVNDIGQTLDGLEAVLITHEHSDHVLGLGTLARKCNVPVYLTPETHDRLPDRIGKLPQVKFFDSGDILAIGDLEIASFAVSHDAVDPVSFTVRNNGVKLGFATDLGHSSKLVKQRLGGCHALILEANYCPEMLRNGHYPAQIQQRIRSRQGHLSNQDMTSLLHDLLHQALQTVVLVHISENNNTPELVRNMAHRVIRDHPAELFLATQKGPTPLFQVTAP